MIRGEPINGHNGLMKVVHLACVCTHTRRWERQTKTGSYFVLQAGLWFIVQPRLISNSLSFCLLGEVGAVFQREGPLHSPCFDLRTGAVEWGTFPVPSLLLPPLGARQDRLPSLHSSCSPWGGVF